MIYSCPLCSQNRVEIYCQDKVRCYFMCADCLMVFSDPGKYLSEEKEKALYDLHENNVDDLGYRHFLSRLLVPMTHRLAENAKGLDFGCGPGPALASMFTEAGYSMSLYDLFYQDDKSVLTSSYDFITATEVVEHLFHPGAVIGSLWNSLASGGYLGIMTKLVTSKEAFQQWH